MSRAKFLSFIVSLLIVLYSVSSFGQEELSLNEEKRDPFIPLIDKDGTLRKNFKKPRYEASGELPAKVSVTGISNIKGVFYAIIDGELLKEGDMCQGLKIEKIEQNRVILSLGEKRFELILEMEKK